VLANPAAERLLDKPPHYLVVHDAAPSSGEYLPATRRADRRASDGDALELRDRRSTAIGKRIRLLVVADRSRALREQQQRPGRGIVRVLSHESTTR